MRLSGFEVGLCANGEDLAVSVETSKVRIGHLRL
jgi:hypothetical protein